LPSRLARRLLLLVLGALGFAAGGFGTLTLSVPPGGASFSVTLSGTDQTATYPLTFTTNNVGATSSHGLHLTAPATQYTNGTHTFPETASSVITIPTPTSCSGGGCAVPVPSGSVTYPVTLPTTGGVTIFSANPGSAIAINVFTATVGVAAPANIYTGTYTSTVTLSLVQGP
jgi:hypothetical protein